MEPNEHQLNSSSSYFDPPPNSAASLNALLHVSDNNTNLFFPPPPHTSAVTSLVETPKRKRGRPRKYGTPEQALGAKKAATSSTPSPYKLKKELQLQQQQACSAASGPTITKNSQQASPIGNSGQGFTPHVLNLVAGEDVGDKIMGFMRQSKRDICIMSASGSISNASICQPATSGGSVTYEGHFEIISLSGSYVHTSSGKTGGMSVCLSNTNGQLIGGGVGGPMTAAGPVQVIIGTFMIDNKHEVNAGVRMEVSIPRLPSPVGGPHIMNVGFRAPVNSSGRNMVGANDERQQAIGGSHFMIQGMQGSAEWRPSLDARRTAGAYELGGIGGHAGAHQSPENGDYNRIPD